MKKHGKVWGETTEFFRNATTSAHHLSIKRGGYCSEHYHKHKFNHFYVISGKLEVTIWRGDLLDKTIVGPGDSTTVPPGYWHKFCALEDTECIEIYHVLLCEPDIARRTQGGMKK